MKNSEPVAVYLRLLRGSKSLKHKAVAYRGSGTHTIKVVLGKHMTPGRATLDLTVGDTAGNEKVLTKVIHAPHRSS